jgi:hypothetical protein
MGFGSGVLVSAVAYELVEEAFSMLTSVARPPGSPLGNRLLPLRPLHRSAGRSPLQALERTPGRGQLPDDRARHRSRRDPGRDRDRRQRDRRRGRERGVIAAVFSPTCRSRSPRRPGSSAPAFPGEGCCGCGSHAVAVTVSSMIGFGVFDTAPETIPFVQGFAGGACSPCGRHDDARRPMSTAARPSACSRYSASHPPSRWGRSGDSWAPRRRARS